MHVYLFRYREVVLIIEGGYWLWSINRFDLTKVLENLDFVDRINKF